MWLVHNGISEDLAFGLDDHHRLAFCIIFAQFQGQKFNWDRMEFEKAEA